MLRRLTYDPLADTSSPTPKSVTSDFLQRPSISFSFIEPPMGFKPSQTRLPQLLSPQLEILESYFSLYLNAALRVTVSVDHRHKSRDHPTERNDVTNKMERMTLFPSHDSSCLASLSDDLYFSVFLSDVFPWVTDLQQAFYPTAHLLSPAGTTWKSQDVYDQSIIRTSMLGTHSMFCHLFWMQLLADIVFRA